MAELNLKPIRTLRSKSDVRSFSHIRPLDVNEFFTSCWLGIFELVYSQKDTEVLLELFVKTVYFFPESLEEDFQKKHAKFIKKFSSVLGSSDYFEIKNLLYSDELWNLLKDIEQWIPVDPNSYIAPLLPLLNFTKINLIEKSDGVDDTKWLVKDAYFTAHLFETDTDIFLLHPKDKISFPVPEIQEKSQGLEESPLLAETDDSILQAEQETQDYLLEKSFSDTETDWKDTLDVLNNGKRPIVLNTNAETLKSPEKISDLGLEIKDIDKFEQALYIDPNNFFKNLVLNILQLLIDEELLHLALSVFTNTVYFYPQSQNKKFELKFLQFIQEVITNFNSNDKEKAKLLVKSEKMDEILTDIQKFIEISESSLILPLFPLIKSWKISILERNKVSEYYWKVNKAKLTLTLYEKSGQVYILAPKHGLGVKKLNVLEGDLQIKEDSLILEQENIETEILNDSSSVLEVHSDLEFENEDIKDSEFDPLPLKVNNKSVIFKPKLEIDIPSISVSSLASPLKSAIKNSPLPPPLPNKPKKSDLCSDTAKISESKPQSQVDNKHIREYSNNDILNASMHSYKSMQVNIQVDKRIEKVEQIVSKRRFSSYDQNANNSLRTLVHCGSFICSSCYRELVKSSHFLFNYETWMHNLKKSGTSIQGNTMILNQGSNCSLCNQKLYRSVELNCAACYLFKTILKDTEYKPTQSCSVLEKNEWVDIRSENKGQMSLCNFCNFQTRKEFVCQICPVCRESACLMCIRKNEYLPNGICSSCRSRRKLSIF